MGKLHRSEFLRELKAEFPQTTADVNAEQGLLHFEMEVFRRFAQRAIFDGEREITARCFALAAKYYLSGNAAMRDAVDVSFVEMLDFGIRGHKRKWAWDLLPQPLKEAYVRFHLRTPV